MDSVKTGRYVISLINAVINNTAIETIPKCADWNEIIEFCEKHKVSNIIGYVIDSVPDVPEAANRFFKEKMKAAILLDAQQDYILEKVCDSFSDSKIDYALLKGTVLKKMYPSRDMRTMSDIDFLVRKDSIDKTRDIMNKNGAKVLLSNLEEDDYQIDTNLFIEIHREMVGEEYSLYNNYYSDVWDKLIKTDGYRYEMTDEDYYIYHVVHLAKHYQYHGVGIRFFLDLYIYLKAMSDKLNWEYISKEFRKLKIDKFNNYACKLANVWFEGDKGDTTLEDMENYVITSGVYGNKRNKEIQRAIKTTGLGKIKYYSKAAFPSLSAMSEKYPVLHKKGYLLLPCWIHRLIKELIRRVKRGKLVASNKDVTTEDKAELANHLQEIGLK